MRKLGSVVLLVAGASGCVIVEDDGYGGGGYYEEPALITAHWQFKDLATDQTTACPAGFDTVAVNSLPVDPAGRPSGQVIIDLFDCADGVGLTDPLDPDVYQTWIGVTNTDGTKMYAESTTTTVDIIERDAAVDTEILNDGGYFSLAWDLVGATSNSKLACTELGATKIALSTATSVRAEADEFGCGDHFGVTGGFVKGDTSVTLTLTNGESNVAEPVILDNKTILDRNRITDLGSVSIPIANR
jgi:hypothetical protein